MQREPLDRWLPRLDALKLWEISVQAQLTRELCFSDPVCSVVRGLFGSSLRQRACLTGEPACDGCPETKSCDYHRLFAEESTGDPLQVHPLWLKGVSFSSMLPSGYTLKPRLVMIEVAGQELLSSVLYEAIKRLGRTPSSPNPATAVEAPILRRLPAPPTTSPEGGWRIEACTPLDLRGNEETCQAMCPQAPWFALLLMAGTRRLRALLRVCTGEEIPELEFPSLKELRVGEGGLRYWQSSRYSRRQQQRTPLRGWVGSVVVGGSTVTTLTPLLQWISLASVGKGTSLGLGELRVTPEL